MQDYNINVNYNNQGGISKTSPNYRTPSSEKTKAITEEKKGSSLPMGFRRTGVMALATTSKINAYVGALTENKVTQRKRQLGLMAVGFGLVAISNPLLAAGAAAIYVADAAIQYNIKQYKENLSAEFLRDLSGGTVNTRR